MKKCSICNTEFDGTQDYCSYCGIRLDDISEEFKEEASVEEYDEPLDEEYDEPLDEEYDEPLDEEYDESLDEEYDESLDEEYDEPLDEEYDEPTDEEYDEPSEEQRCSGCGTKNPTHAKFCMGCASELSGTPQNDIEEVSEKRLILVLPGGKEIEFTGDKLVIGREDFQGILPDEKLKFISRRDNPDNPESYHFCITSDGNEFYILDENSANDTLIEGEKIKGQGERILDDGTEILPAGEISISVRIE